MKCSSVLFRLILLLLILSGMTVLQSCGERVELADTVARKNIVLIAKVKDTGYWKTIQMGADAAAREFDINVRFSAPANETDAKGQLELAQLAVDPLTDAIILAACDYELFNPLIEKAFDAKIPVIAIDSEVDSKRISSFIAADNRDAGRKAANELIKVSGEVCRVAIVSSAKGAGNTRQRENGLYDVISGYPGIKVVAKEYCLSDKEIAKEIAKGIIAEKPGVNTFIALNDKSSLGVAEAIKEAGLAGKVKLVAFDSASEEIDYLEDGVIQAIIVQNPFTMGYLSVKYAVEAIEGRKVPERVDTGVKIINKDNIYQPENQRLLFPFY